MTQQQKITTFVAVVVIILAAGIGLYQYDKSHGGKLGISGNINNDGYGDNAINSMGPGAPSPTPEESTSGGKLPYAEAIKKYKNRIQFTNCSGQPGSVSIKAGTPLMLDNRDQKTHTIRVAGQVFTITSLDYALYYPAAQEGKFNLTCDGGGSASINVEK